MDAFKRALAHFYRSMLGSFLASDARLSWPRPESPRVSVVLVLYNRAELTLRCLRALAEPQHASLEILIVDNASQDETERLLDRLDGVRIIRNRENRGFIRAVNQAARRASGRHLLLLNNDAELQPGALAAALETLEGAADIGAVGGKLVLTDGRLQEAGCLVWSDGSCLGYGRGDSPGAPAYNFRREVDFVSGAFLLTPRELFLSEGGFDEAYLPAYYEDVDYCARLWESGRRVVYEPRATAFHFEFASSSAEDAVERHAERQSIFHAKHAAWLSGKQAPHPDHVLRAREAGASRPHVLFVDDRVPHEYLGAGFPRSREMLLALVALQHRVTFYPLSFPSEDWDAVYRDLPREVEIMTGGGRTGFDAFFRERRELFDVILVSRPHNMRLLRPLLFEEGPGRRRAPVVYDAEALFALRDAGQRALAGDAPSAAELRALVEEEVRLAEGASAVITVSPGEGELFRGAGPAPVFVLGHAVEPSPTPARFEERTGLLFVGVVHDESSPNADAVLWFAREVLPLVRQRLGVAVPLRIVGPNRSERVAKLARRDVEVIGRVDDLFPFFDDARLVVCPDRFGAGIPLKAYHAAAHGVPIVGTPLVARHLGWEAGRDLLVGEDAAGFAERCVELLTDRERWQGLRERGLLRVEAECSRAAFRRRLGEILREAAAGEAAAPSAARQALGA